VSAAASDEARKITPAQKAGMVLRAMAMGQEFRLSSGHKIALHDGVVGVLMDAWKSGQSLDGPPDHQKLIAYDITLNDFIKECDMANEDDLFLMSANAVLSDLAKEKRRQEVVR